MRDGITRLTYQQIEDHWSEKVRKEYEGLNSACNIIEFLKSPQYTITFRYALCRFIREAYGKKKKEDSRVSVVSYADFRAQFSNENNTPKPEEVEDYIKIMMLLAEERGMKEEVIYYFCQFSEEHNNWVTAKELIDWYYEMAKTNDGATKQYAGQSRMMEEHISVILNNMEDPNQQMEAMKSYLQTHCKELRGYSMSAYEVAEELMDELAELTGAEDDIELAIRLWEPIWMQFCTKKADKTGVNRSDFIPWKNLLDLPKTVYEKPLWRARIQKIRKHQVPVEKRDILFLNCMKWTLEQETDSGMDAVQEFIMETNDLLLDCGLSVVYPPNVYDRMILLAICSESPYDVLSDIFHAATDEEKLQEQIEKGMKK